MAFGNSFFDNIPSVTKNLLIINGLVFLAAFTMEKQWGIDLNSYLGLHYIEASMFNPAQFISYMFLHANFSHCFFNMFGLFMFGRVIEQLIGPKRFLTYYLTCGIGAAIIQEITWAITITPAINEIEKVYGQAMNPALLSQMEAFLNMPITIGASGAVFGVLLAFGMLLPNQPIFLLFIPIPIKAKYFVIGYALIELIFGVGNFSFDNIAHFAHLGGMLFGYILLRYWKKRRFQ